MTPRILHISDCHFGDSHYFRSPSDSSGRASLSEAVVSALDSDADVNVLVVSGDLYTRPGADGAETDHAAHELGQLIERLEVRQENVIVVPGNHDLDRKSEDDPAAAFAQYNALTARLGLDSSKVDDLPQVKILEGVGMDPPIAMIVMNSCVAEGAKKPGLGEIGERQRIQIREKLLNQGITPSSHLIVGVLHHHLLPIVDQEVVPREDSKGELVRAPSLTIDAAETLQFLSEHGVSLVLHGHQHVPALLEYSNRMLDWPAQLTVAAAGSCGASGKTGHRRQFWLHEAQAASITSTPFEQGRNAGQFKRQEAIETHRTYPGDTMRTDGCHLHNQALFGPPPTREERPVESDMSVLLLSVTDCPRARAVIHTEIERIRAEELEQEERAPVELDGMYDLLGYWDLLVRLRFPDGNRRRSRVVDPLIDKLLEHGLQIEDNDDFGQSRTINVEWELERPGDYRNRRRTETVELERTRLARTEEYDRLRSQRAFLYVKLPDRGTSGFLTDMGAAIDGAGIGDIVESVSISDSEIVLDLFLRCADSAAINQLNRAIEPLLGRKGCQKYTLLCYGYDEDLPWTGAAELPMAPVA